MTAKISRIHRSYDKLGNQERLRLVANAIRRDDDDEYKVLVDTTPTKTYSMKDAWVGDRAEALWKISISFAFATEEILRTKAEHKNFALLAERDSDDQSQPNKTKVREILRLEQNEYDNYVWAVAEAARRLANHVGLKVEELLAYLPEGVGDRIDWPRHPYPESHTADEARLQSQVDDYYRLFAHHWPGLEVDHECA